MTFRGTLEVYGEMANPVANPAKQNMRIQLEEVLRNFIPEGTVLCCYHPARPNEVLDESAADFINDFRRDVGNGTLFSLLPIYLCFIFGVPASIVNQVYFESCNVRK